MPVCVICEQKVEGWRSNPRRDQRSPVVRTLDLIGAEAELGLCPACGADDRERHTWLYLAASGVLDETAGRRALHVGPEPRLRDRLARLPIQWTFVDADELEAWLAGSDAGPFHLIVCNRVLPAMANVEVALRALGARLSDQGWIVAQSVFAPLLKRTLAFTQPLTGRAAHLFFSEERYLRLFGSDVGEVFATVGLRGGPYRHEDVLPGMDGETWGCNPREPFFLFSRHRGLTAAAAVDPSNVGR